MFVHYNMFVLSFLEEIKYQSINLKYNYSSLLQTDHILNNIDISDKGELKVAPVLPIIKIICGLWVLSRYFSENFT